MVDRIDPDYWRKYAIRARALAANLTSDEARQTILRIAESYDRLAAEMEQRAARISDYRIYFVDSQGRVQAQHGFRAETDTEAVIIASVMGDACSDRCAAYELRNDARLIFPTKRDKRAP